MSSFASQARARAPRAAWAAVERARLSIVPNRRTRAPKAPFAVLVLAILGAGVVGLLMFNTHMQEASFRATALQEQADRLTAQRQGLEMELERLRDPQRLAEAGRALGMVAPGVPAFVSLADGSVVGTPTPATPEDAVRVTPLPPAVPATLRPPPIIVRVPAAVTPTGQTTAATGPASAATPGVAGRQDPTGQTAGQTPTD
jgi:hypothetical protein